MTSQRVLSKSRRALVGLLGLGVAASPLLLLPGADAATRAPMWRPMSTPNTFYPVRASTRVHDLRTSTARHPGTDITAACNAGVYAAHPGRVVVTTGVKWAGAYLVRVVSGPHGLTTGYAYLSRPLVQSGQIVQSGQALGSVGQNPRTHACELYFSVTRDGARQDPTWWLDRYVGHAPPVPRLFDDPAVTVVSFNVLGASHTPAGGRFATYVSRTPRALAVLDKYGTDVAGLQEFQNVQKDMFMRLSQGRYSSYSFVGPRGRADTDNSIVWRNSTMEFLSGSTFDIPYFGGHIRHVPAVLLRQRSTGRTAYFLNVHNPADVHGPAAQWRNRAVAIERAKIIELRATGRPVFLTGDFNDREKAFCPLTADKLTITPNSLPSMTCAYPKPSSIDWIFAAGQTRFTYFVRDTSTQAARISDHPIIVSRAHLQD